MSARPPPTKRRSPIPNDLITDQDYTPLHPEVLSFPQIYAFLQDDPTTEVSPHSLLQALTSLEETSPDSCDTLPSSAASSDCGDICTAQHEAAADFFLRESRPVCAADLTHGEQTEKFDLQMLGFRALWEYLQEDQSVQFSKEGLVKALLAVSNFIDVTATDTVGASTSTRISGVGQGLVDQQVDFLDHFGDYYASMEDD